MKIALHNQSFVHNLLKFYKYFDGIGKKITRIKSKTVEENEEIMKLTIKE